MSFWDRNEKQIIQRWELNRRRIEREVAECRRELVRRNMRQSSEWNNYEPYTDWYLEREVETFIQAVEEVSGGGQEEIDDESLDAMDRMLVELIDRRRQIAPAEVLRQFGTEHARVKSAARVGLLSVQSRRRGERERRLAPPSPPPVPKVAPADYPPSETPPSAAATAPASPPAEAIEAPAAGPIDVHSLADHLRRLAQLIQGLPDAEEQAETLEELQFVAEEAAAAADRRKLRMVGAALERIKARLAAADPGAAATVASHADPIRRWFEISV